MATNGELAAMLAHELADIDGATEEDLFSLRWSGGACPEPLGDAWNMDYLPKGERLAAVVERQVHILRMSLAGLIDMSTRAERAAAELMRRGWQLDSDDVALTKQCGQCGAEAQTWARYCPTCGSRLPAEFGAGSLEDIEAAIAAALGETK